MKKKLGRPALPKNAVKGVLIGARFSPAESRRVHEAVNRAKQGKSAWIRETLLTATVK
jgi:hypothetical protein